MGAFADALHAELLAADHDYHLQMHRQFLIPLYKGDPTVLPREGSTPTDAEGFTEWLHNRCPEAADG